MKINDKIESTQDVLNQTEVALKKLNKILYQDNVIKFFICAILFVILCIIGSIIFMKTAYKDVIEKSDYDYFFPNTPREKYLEMFDERIFSIFEPEETLEE